MNRWGALRAAFVALVSISVAIFAAIIPVQTGEAAVNCTLTSDDPRFFEGTLIAGATLRAVPGQWEPDTTLTYIWRDGAGVERQNGTSNTFVIPADMANKEFQLLVRGEKAGCAPFTRTSDMYRVSTATSVPMFGTIYTGPVVPGQELIYTQPIKDDSVLNRSCYSSIQSWVWIRCSHLLLTAADAGKTLNVKQSVIVGGVTTYRLSSYQISSISGPKSAPNISGVLTVGSTLTANAPGQAAGSTITYSWCRTNPEATPSGICNEVGTGTTYVLTSDDLGNQLFLQAKITESDGRTFIAVSALTPEVRAAVSSTIPLPVITNQYAPANPIVAKYDENWAVALSTTAPAGSTLTYTMCYTTNDCRTMTSLNGYTLIPRLVGYQYFVRLKVLLADGSYVESMGVGTARLAPADFPDTTVAISGTCRTDNTLTATDPYAAVGYGQNATWTRQWLREGVAIQGETASTYVVQPEDVGHRIQVAITMSKANYNTKVFYSSSATATAATLTLSPTPTISGTAAIGQTLTANAGTWNSGVTLSYAWAANNAVVGTDSPTFVVQPEQANTTIRVVVTGSKPGYTSISKSSAVTTTVPYLDFANAPVPTITGFPTPGLTLTAETLGWEDGVSFTYQWMAENLNIANATSKTWDFNSNYLNRKISVKITATKPGYNSRVLTSSQTVPGYLGLQLTPEPVISGTPIVGSTLNAELGTWTEGVSIEYQWYRGATPIAGAITSSYTLVNADMQAAISVKVTGSKHGYASVTKASVPTSPVIGLITSPTTIAISGTMSVGKVLSVSTSDWDSGLTFRYQWFRNSAEIVGATERVYVLEANDIGAGILVRVTASKTGYQDLVVRSGERGPVVAGTLTAPVPTITGTVAVGKVVTAKAGTWTIGTELKYQWFRAGKAIAGATKSTYKLVALDKKKPLTVKVTGSLFGYVMQVKTSAAKTAP